MTCEGCDAKQVEIDRLRFEAESLQASMDLRVDASQRAIRKWHAAGHDLLCWPDYADLCVWLMEEIGRLDTELRRERKEEYIRVTGCVLRVRALNQGRETDEEDRLLDRLDTLWEAMTPEEQQEIRKHLKPGAGSP